MRGIRNIIGIILHHYAEYANIKKIDYFKDKRMALITESEAQKRLNDKFYDLWSIVNGGFEDYKSYSEKNRLLHSSTTMATIIHDHQVARASSYAVKNGAFGTKLVELSKLKILVIDEIFAIRFKKLNYEKKSSNQPTQQVKDFLSQNTLDGIGLPTTYNLEAGYILTADNNEISGIYLTCPKGHKERPYWSIELMEEAAETIEKDIFETPDDIDSSDDVIIVPKRESIVVPLGKEKDEH